MKKILSLDSPLIQFMEHVADFIVLNLITAVCCVPFITVGAAITAHYKIMQDLTLDEEEPVLRAYFRAFAANFKQATVLWLIVAFFLAFFAVDVFVIHVYFDEGWAHMTYLLLAVLGTVGVGVVCYAVPLIARYQNTLKEHLRNSFILAVGNLPRTLLLVFLAAIPLLLALVSIELFLNTAIIWFVFGISVILFLQALVLRPVIEQLEKSDAQDTQEA